MKLALLTDRPHSTYGAELNLLALGQVAGELGHEAVAVSIESGPFLDAAAERGLATELVERPDQLVSLTQGGLRPTPVTVWRLARFGHALHARLRESGADVVVTSSARVTAMTWPGRFRRPRLLWYVQMLARPGPATGAAAVAAAHVATIAPGVEATIPPGLRWLTRRRTSVLPPWRDLDAFAAPTRSPAGTGPLRVITVGKVTPRKGIDVLVEGAARARRRGADIEVVVVGDPSGPSDVAYHNQVDQQARDHGVPVEWAGWHDDVAPLLATADVFALVSDREGLPGAAVEAMASGLPVVVSDTGPIATLVRTHECGLVAPVGDADVVAAHLELLASDARRRERYGQAALAASRMFSADETKAAIGAILHRMAPSIAPVPARHPGADS